MVEGVMAVGTELRELLIYGLKKPQGNVQHCA